METLPPSCQNLSSNTVHSHGMGSHKSQYLHRFSTSQPKILTKFVIDMWDSIHKISSKFVMVMQGALDYLTLSDIFLRSRTEKIYTYEVHSQNHLN